MVTINEERDFGHVDRMDFAQAPITLNVPGAVTVHTVPLPAPQAPRGNADTTNARPPQRQQDVRAPAGTDAPNAIPLTNAPQGVPAETSLVAGLNLKTALENDPTGKWKPKLEVDPRSGRHITTRKHRGRDAPLESSIFAPLSSMLAWMRPGPSGGNDDANAAEKGNVNANKGEADGGKVVEKAANAGKTEATVDDGVSKIETLHRYNVLWARSKLLRHFHQPRSVDLVSDEVAGEIYEDLQKYSNALRDYRFFRTEGELLFQSDYPTIDFIAKEFVQLEEKRSRLKELPQGADAKELTEKANTGCAKIGKILSDEMPKTSSGMTEEQYQKSKQLFWDRLFAALGGGLALIAPMLIMVLAPPAKATALATTCCFVLAVAIALAIFMEDSHPKDVVACIAAYTAVLVVFVGVGGGT